MTRDEIEAERRNWAGQQKPELATLAEIAMMFGHRRPTYVPRIMKRYGLAPVEPVDELAPDGVYYNRKDALRVVDAYQEDMRKDRELARKRQSEVRRVPPQAKQPVRLSGVQVSAKPEEHRWTRQHLEQAWSGRTEAQNAIGLLFRRCPSFQSFSFDEAKAFVAILVDDRHQMNKPRSDRSEFLLALRKLDPQPSEVTVAERAINAYYSCSDNFGRLNPSIAARVVLELVRTAPKLK